MLIKRSLTTVFCSFGLYLTALSCTKDSIPDELKNTSTKNFVSFSILGSQGTIGADTVAVTVPYGTSLTALVATFSTNGSSVNIGGVNQTSGVTVNNFSAAKVYTVVGSDGTTKDYTVTVTVSAPSTAKDFTAFSILGQPGTIGASTITVTVPFGTNVTALVPTFTITGVSVNISSVSQTSGTTANDFTSAKVYTVVAQDSSTKNYTVTVSVAANTAKDITAFSILSQPAAIGANSINVSVPFGTDVTALIASFTTTGASVNISSVNQTSGATANNFTAPQVYTVVAADSSTKNYTATVCVLAALMGGSSSLCPILSGTVVTTVAGPPSGSVTPGDTDDTGNAARFYYPGGITTDGTNLYVSDSYNHKIRKVVIATGVTTVLAGPAQGCYSSCATGDIDGTGNAARFNYPYGITTDGTNLYVADGSNNKIRKIVIATGVVTTFAGPAQGTTTAGDTDATGNSARFNNPRSIATDGTNLFVGDVGWSKIRKIVIATGAVTTIAGPAAGSTGTGDTDGTGNAARFNQPTGITTDGTYLYITDQINNKIRRLHISSAAVTTLAGPAQGTTTLGDTDGTGNAARFGWPQGITTDGTNLFITEASNNKIRKVVISTGAVSTLAGPASGSTTPSATDGTGTAARFNSPRSITTNGLSLFVADYNNSKIRKIE